VFRCDPPGADCGCAPLVDVGLGYIKLVNGPHPSPAARLSGSSWPGAVKTGHRKTLYLIDEPPPALSF